MYFQLYLITMQALACHISGIPQRPREQGKMLAEKDIIRILQEISQSIDGFDYAKAADLVRETGKQKLDGKYRQVFVQLGQWMDEMDVDKIQEMIEELCR